MAIFTGGILISEGEGDGSGSGIGFRSAYELFREENNQSPCEKCGSSRKIKMETNLYGWVCVGCGNIMIIQGRD